MSQEKKSTEELEDHMLLESPHFRPAFNDITNEPALPVIESPGDATKKRKSMGRRVSFAAKAKVRYIDKESDEEGNDAVNKEEDDPFLVKENVMALVSTLATPRNVQLNNYGSLKGNGFESPRSEAAMSIVSSNDSIEVELKDPQNSFNSLDSATDEASGRNSIGGLDDMEMTGCVGGIISAVAADVPCSQAMMIDDTMAMDLTMTVGGILKTLPSHISVAVLDSPSSADTMELTRTVGGILKDFRPPPSESLASVPGSPMSIFPSGSPAAAVDEDDMNMTVIIKDTIKLYPTAPSVQQPASPSPFLTKSPARLSGVFKSPLQSELSFIGDIDQPDNLMIDSPIPMAKVASLTKQPQEVVEEAQDEPTMELFNSYIDTNRLKAASEVMATSLTPKKPMSEDLPPSQTESPTVTILLPRASLRDFLNETGVRFLDNLSSLARRETLGKPRESEIVTPGKQLFVDCGVSIEGDALDAACLRLSTMITTLRDDLSKREEKFNHSPPLAYLEYQRSDGASTERAQVVSKLKVLKSMARLHTKQAWYEWRNKVHRDLNQKLQANLSVLSRRVLALSHLCSQLDELINKIEPMVVDVTAEASRMRDRAKSVQSGDWEHAQQLEELLQHQQTKINLADQEMNGLVKREAELRASIEAAVQKRQMLQQRTATLKQEIESIPECSPSVLDELKSSFALHQGVTGWKVHRLDPVMIILQYARAELGVTFKISPLNVKVESITFDCAQVKSRIIKHAHRLFKTLPEMGLKEAITWIGNRLDRLHQIDKQLSSVDVKCTVSIPENLNHGTDIVPIALGFFHPQSKSKFDILLALDGEAIHYSQFLPFSGPILESHLLDVIMLSLQHEHFPIRRLVLSIFDIMENKLSQ